MLKRLLTLIRTLQHLKTRQLLYLLVRRVLPTSARITNTMNPQPRTGLTLLDCPSLATCSDSDWTFTFLNRTRRFSQGQTDWECPTMPKLWRYNLHYFDYLQNPHRSLRSKSHLITDWIAHNPIGTADAWEPYTASLRIVNWIKFFLSTSSVPLDAENAAVKPEWLKSLYQQALWLEQNIEYHLLANHYLKNGVALFFAGAFFEGVDAERWRKKGWNILREELDEQFLADGGHFERSPMYHAICVTDYLDVLNLAHNPQIAPSHQEDCDTWKKRITKSLSFLDSICLPDGDIPLLNDSAMGIAPSSSQIIEYAKRVIGYAAPIKATGVAINAHSASGYYICRNSEDMMIIDCGAIGPDYQPGHAHCDTLSFELTLGGRQVFVDSGVFDYEDSPERTYARSTRAHNTVMLDSEEQSEVWGVFRVARRAQPLSARIEQASDGSVSFVGAHDGYTRLAGSPIHHRYISYDGKTNWMIEDSVTGAGVHQMDSFLHVHPDFTVIQREGHLYIVDPGNRTTIAVVEPIESLQMKLKDEWHFPEFGVKRANQTIIFTCSGPVPLSMRYRIRKVARIAS